MQLRNEHGFLKLTFFLVIVPILVVTVLIVGAFNGFEIPGKDDEAADAFKEIISDPHFKVGVDQKGGTLTIVAEGNTKIEIAVLAHFAALLEEQQKEAANTVEP